MIDFRLYRVAWIPALLAFVVMMFSLEGVPEPPDPQIAPATFDSERARQNVREILALGDDRSPGSDADAGTAALVQERFERDRRRNDVAPDVRGGRGRREARAAQRRDHPRRRVRRGHPRHGGARLGRRARAPPRAPPRRRPCSSSPRSWAAPSTRRPSSSSPPTPPRTAPRASGSSSTGSTSPRRIAAALSLHQPGAAEPVDPFVLRHSTDDRSTSMQLVRIAEETLSEQSGREPEGRGVFAELARLALPMAAGEQSVLIAEEVDAVGISSAGEKPLDPAEDDEEHFSAGTLEEFGAATLGVILVLDPLVQPLQHGPDTYVEFSESLVPGWAIAVFTLALLLPAVVAAVDGVARAARRRAGEIRALVWAFALALPLAALVLVIVLLGAAGIVPVPLLPLRPGPLLARLLGGAAPRRPGRGDRRRIPPRRPLTPAPAPVAGGPGARARLGGGRRRARRLASEPVPRAAAGAPRPRLAPRRPSAWELAPPAPPGRARVPAAAPPGAALLGRRGRRRALGRDPDRGQRPPACRRPWWPQPPSWARS